MGLLGETSREGPSQSDLFLLDAGSASQATWGLHSALVSSQRRVRSGGRGAVGPAASSHLGVAAEPELALSLQERAGATVPGAAAVQHQRSFQRLRQVLLRPALPGRGQQPELSLGAAEPGEGSQAGGEGAVGVPSP